MLLLGTSTKEKDKAVAATEGATSLEKEGGVQQAWGCHRVVQSPKSTVFSLSVHRGTAGWCVPGPERQGVVSGYGSFVFI